MKSEINSFVYGLIVSSACFLSSPVMGDSCEEGTLEEVFGFGGEVCMNMSTGSPGGSYVGVFGSNFSRLMDDYGFGFFKVVTSQGSFENLRRVAQGRSAFGLAQKDVQLYLEFKHNGTIPEARLTADEQQDLADQKATGNEFAFGQVVKVAELVDECLYVAVNKNKSTKTLSDLRRSFANPDDRPNINIGPRGSGSYYTWSFVTALNPQYGFSNRQQFFGLGRRLQSFDLGLEELLDPRSKTEAVIWVIDPNNLDNSRLKAVLASPQLEILSFNDPTLIQPLTPELLSRDAEELLNQGSIDVSEAPVSSPAAPQDLLAETLSQFNQADEDSAPTFNFAGEVNQVVGGDSTAYHLRNVRLSKASSRTVQTVCTRAALYAHKNLSDLNLKVDDFTAYFSVNTPYQGSLWVEILGLIQEYWAEIVSSDY